MATNQQKKDQNEVKYIDFHLISEYTYNLIQNILNQTNTFKCINEEESDSEINEEEDDEEEDDEKEIEEKQEKEEGKIQE
ncbi:hypothetical protein IMG5_175370 [Ichthyophthirius multifiliis]|uniref:Uncharacterized protein n=1 Tax=Ichthyophthirius multifiliis TaxID=5932 RepID=G0R263_ICHMU|nr:hypothetical protein IMG5_175370 [Ichthyophthirius multifiliis]EGR28443.1 hypothetical protein IMG5_175370 [Ichthyophthirius multifiliis]|eukprot:XP_004029679.1 hypothetical protein IMG5_175370 [Ichthyophthirius multifiliis]